MKMHKPQCGWPGDYERCTCGALVMRAAYRFPNGNIIAFDQHGHQMPYYQLPGLAADRIANDFGHITIREREWR